jgi:methanogenic corrinoid protein MtbC1
LWLVSLLGIVELSSLREVWRSHDFIVELLEDLGFRNGIWMMVGGGCEMQDWKGLDAECRIKGIQIWRFEPTKMEI